MSTEEDLKQQVWLQAMKEELDTIEKKQDLEADKTSKRQESHQRQMDFQAEAKARWINWQTKNKISSNRLPTEVWAGLL